MRLIPTTIAAAILAGSQLPASAQSFYPYLYGARYCQLRALGISAPEARATAMREAYSLTRPVQWVTYAGQRVSIDTLDAARYVVSNCPEQQQ